MGFPKVRRIVNIFPFLAFVFELRIYDRCNLDWIARALGRKNKHSTNSGPVLEKGRKNPSKHHQSVRGTHTLHSSGLLKSEAKKGNEYFGGDSTVVEAVSEDDEDEKENDNENIEEEEEEEE